MAEEPPQAGKSGAQARNSSKYWLAAVIIIDTSDTNTDRDLRVQHRLAQSAQTGYQLQILGPGKNG